MKPAPFTYHRAGTVADAVAVLTEFGDEAKVLAGGQSLVPMLALRLARPEHLVDVTRVAELAGSRRQNGHLVVGAGTRHAELERDSGIGEAVPLLRLAAPHIGHFQIRNRGTLGGSLAHADAAAELPAVARALDAEMVVAGPHGQRVVPAAEFFLGTFTTALEPEEVLVAVRFPVRGPGSGYGLAEMARRHGDFALAGAVCAVSVDGGRIERAAIAMIGMDYLPVRAPACERALVGAVAGEVDLAEAGAAAVADLDPPTDVHAGARYRKRVGAVLVARALSDALREAGDA